jgi:Holliday junction resolvase
MRAARIDVNQPIIVKAFRGLGWKVAHTHMVGKGFPDIVCSKAGTTILVEIKDGSKPPSAQKLTAPEQEFHSMWEGALYIVASVDEVFELHRSLFVTGTP